MSLGSDDLEINVVTELHVLGVDLHNLKTAGRVGNTNVDLAIETAEAAKSGIDGVGSVGRSHDNDVRAGLHAVHEGEQLGNDSALDLTVGLVTLGGDRVDLVDEDDRRRVLLGLLESLAQVRFRLTSHLGHDLRAVDQEEESASLVGNGTRHECLTGTRRTVHENTTRRLDTDGLEELRMPQRQLNELTDLCHLLAAAADVVIADLVEVALLVLALNWLALAVDDGILCDDTELWGSTSTTLNSTCRIPPRAVNVSPCRTGR